jgi:hypothetical protein
MSRFLFFLLIVANIAYGIHAWQTNAFAPASPVVAVQEIDATSLKIIEVRQDREVAQRVEASKQEQVKLAQGPCLLATGLLPTQIEAARTAAAQLGITPQLVERPLEQVVRYWTFVPKQASAKAQSDLINLLKNKRIDYSVLPDGDVSLGVFAAEEAATRLLASVQSKGLQLAKAGAKSKEIKEYQWLLRNPDEASVSKLMSIKRDIPSIQVAPEKCEVFG